ncbi:MAG: tRNA (adenosine(37)-N6)-threonylcarbamoyltransferase complex dimerization subunit type 1 TsaB [Caldilineaceae bacterium]
MLLALDTATATASLAVYDLESNHLLAELTWQARRRQTQDLLLAARTLLAQVDLTPSDLTALAVTTGPGSFTGVRIGISAVKGIALGLPTPPQVIGIPTLNVTAAPWLAVASSMPGVTICAYMQAGRGRYNWSYLRPHEPSKRLTTEDHQNGTVDELVDDLQRQSNQVVWLVGETTSDLQDRVKPLAHVVFVEEVSGWRRAGHLAQLAAHYLQAGIADSLSELQPIYLRQP